MLLLYRIKYFLLYLLLWVLILVCSASGIEEINHDHGIIARGRQNKV